jgi:hypothetical protein
LTVQPVLSSYTDWAIPAHVEVSVPHTHTPNRTPLNEWSACRKGRYLHNKHKVYCSYKLIGPMMAWRTSRNM